MEGDENGQFLVNGEDCYLCCKYPGDPLNWTLSYPIRQYFYGYSIGNDRVAGCLSIQKGYSDQWNYYSP